MTLKRAIKPFVPPILLESLQGLRGKNSDELSGDYQSWDEALKASSGYDSDVILEKTKQALLKVKSGEAAYERDSVLFDKVQYAWPVLAALMWTAAQNNGALHVLDFGGSLGSAYFQNRAFLHSLPKVSWHIIEQAHYIAVGRQWFQDDTLRFYATIDESLAESQPNIVLLGSVLQYLEEPYRVLERLLALPCPTIIIDKTPFWQGITDKLCVQKVSPDIYPASYPAWIFSMPQFLSFINKKGWATLAQFGNPEKLAGPVEFAYSGMVCVRQSANPKTMRSI